MHVQVRAAYDYYYKLSSFAQDVAYVTETLTDVLGPENYQLVLDSVHISDAIGGKGMATKTATGGLSFPALGSKVRNDKYNLRVVRFAAIKNAIRYSGWVYLVIARTEISGLAKVPLSALAKKGWSHMWKSAFWSSLAFSDDVQSFLLEVRPQNLNMIASPEIPEFMLPQWGIPRENYPKVSSVSIFNYLQENLTSLLQPMQLNLIAESIDLELQILIGTGLGFPPSLRILEGENYSVRYIPFMARDSNQNLVRGAVHLVIARPDAKDIIKNQSFRQILDSSGARTADLFLVVGPEKNSFPLDVSFTDLNLTLIPSLLNATSFTKF